MKTYIQKYIASSGYCSRRQAEALVKSGKVKVNGQEVAMGYLVDSEIDSVCVKGENIQQSAKKIYIKLNKPKGFVCTTAKFKDEKSVLDLVNLKDRLYPVGRLDKDSRGLVLLTNDGLVANKLTHPRYEHEKKYQVKVKENNIGGLVVENIIIRMKSGISSEGEVLKAKEVSIISPNTFELILAEGKKRQIRRMFKALDLNVEDLKRTSISTIQLGNLKEGEWSHLSKEEIEDIL